VVVINGFRVELVRMTFSIVIIIRSGRSSDSRVY